MEFLNTLETSTQELTKSILNERFKKNHLFFKQNNPKLAQLQTKSATNFGIVIDSKGINVINLRNGDCVYGSTETRHLFIDSSKTLAADPYAHSSWKIYTNDVDLYHIDEDEKFKLTGKYSNKIKQIFINDSRFLPNLFHLPSDFLPSLSFFGLGGGLFIEYLLEKYTTISSFFIYEPDVDFFIISCYFVDYEKLFSRSLFSGSTIVVGMELEPGVAKEFFSQQKITAGFIRLELSLYGDDMIARAKKIFELAQNSCVRGWGTYEDEMSGYKNQLKNIDLQKPLTPILAKPKKISAPICVVGNGSSLDGLICFLKENQESLIIFSCGTSLRTLLKNGIKPDFQIEIERMDYLSDILKEAGYTCDIPIIASNVANPSTVALSNEPLLFFRDFTAGSYIKQARTVLHFGSPFVGNAGVNLALSLSDEVILCGIDVGYKQGSTVHSKDSIYSENQELPEGSVETRPNFEDSVVYSNALFNLSKENIERAIFYLKPKRIINISDGAYISGAKPCRHAELKIKKNQKSSNIELLKKSFSRNCVEVFQDSAEVDIVNSMKKIQVAIMNVLSTDVQNKEELFRVFDRFAFRLEEHYETDMSAMLLLSGSIRHIVFNAFMAFIHISSNDIGELYKKFAAEVNNAFEGFIADFSSNQARNSIATLLFKK